MRVLLLAAVLAAHGHAAPCAGLANRLASAGSGTQLITVTASEDGATLASLELWTRRAGCWRRVAGPWTARLGYSGLSDHKREGDGATPTGLYAIGSTVYGIEPDPGLHTAYHRLVCGDWWDEDPSSPAYNTFRHVRCGTRPPFGGASEALWQATVAYRQFAVIEYNAAPVVPGRGSAIFLHDDLGHPTNGCVSLPHPELLQLLRWLRPAAHPHIALGTLAEIDRF
jgi:L,D-peptidoglycan transpeptidase YkuD (ErfK/YbiS/YcfS/YnhG family)